MNKLFTILIAILMVFCLSPLVMADDTIFNQKATAESELIVNNYGDEQKELTTTRIDAKGYRGFTSGQAVPIPVGPAYFGVATPGPQFQSVKTILAYKDTFLTEELVNMAKGCDVEVLDSPLYDAPKKEDLYDSVKMFIAKPVTTKNVKLVGYLTVKADARDDVSVDVMAKAGLAGRVMGGNAIHITAEGTERSLKSFAWGIGFAGSVATVSDSEQTGTLNTGGFGVSGGTAGYVDFPWLQVFVLEITE